jgi:hypothetical protein
MKVSLTLFVSALLLSAQLAAEPSTESIVRHVNLSKGISWAEAAAIAEVYFSRNINGCGAAAEPVDRGDHWAVTPLVGIAAAPDPNPIVIEKRTGRVSWKRGPTFATLQELLAHGP